MPFRSRDYFPPRFPNAHACLASDRDKRITYFAQLKVGLPQMRRSTTFGAQQPLECQLYHISLSLVDDSQHLLLVTFFFSSPLICFILFIPLLARPENLPDNTVQVFNLPHTNFNIVSIVPCRMISGPRLFSPINTQAKHCHSPPQTHHS